MRRGTGRLPAPIARWGRVLLVAQVAVSVVLLVGAALLTRSLYLLQHNDLGIRSAGIVTVRTLPLPGAANNQRNSLSDFNLYLRTDCRAAWCPRRRVLASLPSRRRVRWRADPVRRRGADGAVDGERLRLVRVLLDARHSAAGRPSVHDGRRHVARNRWSWSARAWRARCRPTATSSGAASGSGRSPPTRIDVIVGVVGNATQGNPREADPFVVYRPLQLTATSSLSANLLIATDDPPSGDERRARDAA